MRGHTAPVNVFILNPDVSTGSQDDNFNRTNSWLTLNRNQKVSATNFLFGIPSGLYCWKFDVDDAGNYLSDRVTLIDVSFPLVLSQRSSYRQLKKTYHDETLSLFSQSKASERIALEKQFRRTRKLISKIPQLVYDEIIARRDLAVTYFSLAQYMLEQMKHEFDAKKRLHLEKVLLKLIEKTQKDFQVAIYRLYGKMRFEEKHLHQKYAAELQIVSDGDVTPFNANVFLMAIKDAYLSISTRYLHQFNEMIDILLAIKVNSADAVSFSVSMINNYRVFCQAFTGLINDEDVFINATLLFETVARMRLDLPKITFLDETFFNSRVNLFLLKELIAHPLFDVYPFPFVAKLDKSVEQSLIALRGAYYSYTFCDLLYNNPALTQTCDHKKRQISQFYAFLLKSVTEGEWNLGEKERELIKDFNFESPARSLPKKKHTHLLEMLDSSLRVAHGMMESHIPRLLTLSSAFEPAYVKPDTTLRNAPASQRSASSSRSGDPVAFEFPRSPQREDDVGATSEFKPAPGM